MSATTEATSCDRAGHERMGARIRELRLRYGLRLADVCAATGLNPEFLSRLERGTLRIDRIKPGTFHLVLEGIGVTEQELRAVFHVEPAPTAMSQIREEVTRTARLFEEVATPTALLDDRWNWWYVNRSGRQVFGLTGEEYSRLLGSHTLLHIVDVNSPMYSRFSDEMRRIYFSWKVTSFKFHFADQEFSRWYRDVAAAVCRVDWAARIWSKPLILPTLLDSHEVTLSHPAAGELHLRDQLNIHMRSPRFRLIEWAPTDQISALKASALSTPEEWLPKEIADAIDDNDGDTSGVTIEEKVACAGVVTEDYRPKRRPEIPLTSEVQLQPCPSCQQPLAISRRDKLLN